MGPDCHGGVCKRGSTGGDELRRGAGKDLIRGGRGDELLDGDDDDDDDDDDDADREARGHAVICGLGVDTVEYSGGTGRVVDMSLGAARLSLARQR